MLLVALFVIGYLAIVFEHPLKLNKAASALVTGVACWTAYIFTGDAAVINGQLAITWASFRRSCSSAWCDGDRRADRCSRRIRDHH
jgi:hypothetical protein